MLLEASLEALIAKMATNSIEATKLGNVIAITFMPTFRSFQLFISPTFIMIILANRVARYVIAYVIYLVAVNGFG